MSNAIIRNPVVDRPEAERLVASVSWFHRVEVLPGLIAPGVVPSTGSYDAKSYIDSLKIEDIAGKRILELGTWDGPLAFDLKLRGADVVASDIQDPAKTGFHVLEKVSGLTIPYVRTSVYDLSSHFGEEFDVILYFGIFYHLKHPILSFEQVAKCLKPNGVLFTEGEALGRYFEDIDGEPVDIDDATFDRLEDLDKLGVPLTLSYPGKFIGAKNWVLPNQSALKGWLRNAGLEPESTYVMGEGKQRRVGAKAHKVRPDAYVEHGLVGEEGGFGATVRIT